MINVLISNKVFHLPHSFLVAQTSNHIHSRHMYALAYLFFTQSATVTGLLKHDKFGSNFVLIKNIPLINYSATKE